ncbi:hypothetical protein SFA35_06160 [Pseudomonas sp. HR96]|uniref:hypothetical protein n=1 Tax=Pseudomonas sp. HR96 TaxID=1027966 RepID=UPI002A762DEA|nr:hypothetical protein [Pseudomonas sp. HR96]WPP00949.1 hypothetical protein SFA35_06160 [Pseudomonas sp. HR96]
MPGQNTSFHELLHRIAAGATELSAPEDVDTTSQLISFGFATADFVQHDGHLTYTNVRITPQGRGYVADWDGPHGSAIR